MIVRRLAARGVVKTGSTEEEPRRKRAKRFLLIVFSFGALSGVLALLGIPPFGNLQTLINQLFYSGPNTISASTLFPPVQAVHKVVDVYDPPPPAAHRSAPNPVAAPQPTPTRTPRPTPSGSPPPDD